jgi:hypothetical protein
MHDNSTCPRRQFATAAMGQARQVANDIVSTDPAFRVPDLDAKNPYKDEHRLTTIKEALREAGLPD